MSEEITIRSIQHYMYCPHRWGLVEIDRAWAENMFVTKANQLHERVHNTEQNYSNKKKKVFTAVSVYNDKEPYNLYGVLDCLELTENKQGISINGSAEKYKLCIVEYKPTKPKDKDYHEEDLIQVLAQKICVDYVFGCDCDAVIYYGDVKKRIKLPIHENFTAYHEQLTKLLNEMRVFLEKGKIPPIRKAQNCNGCSMKDLCMPSEKTIKSISLQIKEIEKKAKTEEKDWWGNL